MNHESYEITFFLIHRKCLQQKTIIFIQTIVWVILIFLINFLTPKRVRILIVHQDFLKMMSPPRSAFPVVLASQGFSG